MNALTNALQNRAPTRVYTGKNHCCRCGCKGKYHVAGTPGFKLALARAARLVETSATIPENLGSCVDFPHGNDRAITVYFD